MVAVVPRVEMGEQFEGPEVIAMRMHLVLPNGRKKEMWDFLILVFVLYNALMVPFGLAFYDFFNLDVSLIGFVCDSSIDALFIIDLFIAFRTTYYDFYGNLVLDRRKVMVHYVRSWFLPDLIASIPYEQIALLIALLAGVTIGSITGLLKLMKLAKLLRLTRLAKKLERIAAAKTFRVLQFVLMLLTFAHWYACLWFWMGSSKPPDEGEAINPLPGMNGTSWIFRTQMEDEHFMMQYLASFYWALSMVMKSPWFHPVAPGEFAFASVMMIFGCVLFAYFLGNVTAVITAANASSGKYRDQIGQIRGFCKSHGLSRPTTSKLLAYTDALWSERRGGVDRRAMLAALPSHLLPKVTIEMYEPLLAACPWMYDCTSGGCAAILLALKVEVCDTNDVLVRAGTLQSTMYILMRGELRINFEPEPKAHKAAMFVPNRVGAPRETTRGSTIGDNRKIGMHGRSDRQGSLLGFQDVFSPAQYIEYTVRAVTRSSLLSLTRGQLKEVLTTHADDKEVVRKAIEHANATLAPAKHRQKAEGKRLSDAMVVEDVSASDTAPTPVVPATIATVGEHEAASSHEMREQVATLRSEVSELNVAMAEQTLMLARIFDELTAKGPKA